MLVLLNRESEYAMFRVCKAKIDAQHYCCMATIAKLKLTPNYEAQSKAKVEVLIALVLGVVLDERETWTLTRSLGQRLSSLGACSQSWGMGSRTLYI